jgi:hypothetical protein
MNTTMRVISAILLCFAVFPFCAQADPKPIIDNERVTVWDVTAGKDEAKPTGDALMIYLTGGGKHKARDVVFEPKGSAHQDDAGSRAIVIDLKDHVVPPLPNTTSYPNAFPRPGVKKVFENGRIVVWDYMWLPDRATPMHFHDKDVVVVYFEDGALKSTTPDGQSLINEYTFATTRFNRRDRTHTELLVKGTQHAVMMELK